ncbi:C-type lectin domain-containing protein, partial [Patescibacteria group bacterium]|nr:C-type lectin domain-containing protein [Patescibacteria group bacterium]
DMEEGDDGISGIEYIRNKYPLDEDREATCTYTTGGYCGDGIVQHYYITTTKDDKTIYTGTVNTMNPGIDGYDDNPYIGKTGPDNLIIEECDPLNFTIPANLKNASSTYTYSCTSDCKLKAKPSGSGANPSDVGGYCGDGYIEYQWKNDGIAEVRFELQSDYDGKTNPASEWNQLEICDPLDYETYSKPSPSESNLNWQYECTDSCTFSGGYCGDENVQSDYGEECDYLHYNEPSPSNSSLNSQYECTANCGFTGGYCGDGIVQDGNNGTKDHSEKCDPNQEVFVQNYGGTNIISPSGEKIEGCKDNCSGCKSGYYLNDDGKCVPPNKGYMADGINQIRCTPSSDEENIEGQYDPRSVDGNFYLPNDKCLNCKYTEWEDVDKCSEEGYWELTRVVDPSEYDEDTYDYLVNNYVCLDINGLYMNFKCDYCNTFDIRFCNLTYNIKTNWHPNEPNNNDNEEHCGEIRREYDYQWNDMPCKVSDNIRPAVCEFDTFVNLSWVNYFNPDSGHWYGVTPRNFLSWNYARYYCCANGGYLLNVDNMDEYDDIISGLSLSDSTSYYLGYSDQRQEGVWELYKCEPLYDDYWSHWGVIQPDNAHDTGEDYVEIVNYHGYYAARNDVYSIYKGICEYENAIEDYDFYNGHYYKLSPKGAWNNVKQYCCANGGYLVNIDSEREAHQLYTEYLLDTPHATRYYIGLSDKATEGVWKWYKCD